MQEGVTIERQEGKEYILSLSYGKDSIACLFAIEQLGWPLDRIVHAEVWATDTIPADPPPMVEFKTKADEFIQTRYGIQVEHIRHKMTFEEMFYRKTCRGKFEGTTKGWPLMINSNGWCKHLKITDVLRKEKRSSVEAEQGAPCGPCLGEEIVCGRASRRRCGGGAVQGLHILKALERKGTSHIRVTMHGMQKPTWVRSQV